MAHITIKQSTIQPAIQIDPYHLRSATAGAIQRQVGEALAKRMRTYIDELVADGEDVNAASVALRFDVSYAYVKVVFKAHAGQPIGGYIRRRKLEQACLMLKADEPPFQVARYICWSYGHFNKAFKARYGVSPRVYKG